MSRRAMMLTIVGVSGVSSASAQNWAELGPAPIRDPSAMNWTGRMSSVAASPTNPSLYYAGGADAGLWRSTDAGASWTPLSNSWVTTAVGCIAIDPTNEQVIYVGTGEAEFANHSRYGLGIYKTTDGGNTWAQLAESTFAGRCISTIVVDHANPQVVYAAVTPAGGFPALAAAKDHPQRTGPLGVFKSLDGGVTWGHVDTLVDLSVTDLVMDPSNAQTLYAGVGHIFGSALNGVYKTTNGGTTWTRMGAGLPAVSLFGRIGLAIAPSSPQRVFALIARPSDGTGGGASNLGGFTSANGAASWTGAGSVDQSTYGWFLNVASVNPANANQVFYGGLQMTRFTIGGGSATVTPPHVDIHALAWDAAGRLLSGDDGGVHRTSNLGMNWEHLNNGMGSIQFYAGVSTSGATPEFVIGGAQDNGSSIRFGPGPADWEHVFGGDGGWTQFTGTFPTPSAMFVEAQGTGGIARSIDGGETFSAFGTGLSGRNCFLPPYLIDPSDPNRLLYGTHRVNERIGTNPWAAISPDLTDGAGAIRTLAICQSNSQYVYAATNDGNVQRSSDGGHTFTQVRDNVPGWPRTTREIFVNPWDGTEVWLAVAAFGTEQILRSTDAGANWVAMDAGLMDVPVNSVAVDYATSPPTIFAGTDRGVWRSDDDGASFRRHGCGLPEGMSVIDVRVEETGPLAPSLFIATQGRGAWRVSLIDPADWDRNRIVNSTDVGEFINDWFEDQALGTLITDFNGDGVSNSVDVSDFINAWFFAQAGIPYCG